jgi:large subunit ribosomal protein L4
MSEHPNFSASAYTAQGTARDQVTLPTDVFDGTVNVPVMHQAVTAYLANQRQGTAKTKTRGHVVGGNQKPWRQKGTGRARQGSTRSPQWVGGGTVFGPIPRSYRQDLPKQVRQLARKSAFNARARENAIVVIDQFDYDAPKTSRLLGLVQGLGVLDRKVLILTNGMKENVFLSGRNLQDVHVMPYAEVTTYHLLWSEVVLIESGALGESLAPIAESARPAKPARKASTTAKHAAEAEAPAKAAPKKGGLRSLVPRKAAAKEPVKEAKKPAAKSAEGKSASKTESKSAPKKKGGK